MSEFILWLLIFVTLIIAYNYLSYKLDVKTKIEKEMLNKKECEIQNQSHVLDLKKENHDIDLKEKLSIIEDEKNHLDKFHQDTLSMMKKNKIENQNLITMH